MDFLVVISSILVVVFWYLFFATIGFGSILAVVISWSRNSSVLWAIIHGWLSWFYVIYYCLKTKR